MGSFSTTYRGWTYRVDWSESISVANNTSTITCQHYLVAASGYSMSIATRSNSCTVGGVTKTFTSPAISGGGTVHLGTTVHTITHNTDGTLTVNFSSTFNVQATLSGVYQSSWTATANNVVLTTIPRKSGVSATNAFIGDACTITISKASSSFTHTLSYKISGQSSYTTIVSGTTASSYSWTLPTSVYNYIGSTSKSVTITIGCDTYSGGTYVGGTTCTMTATVKESACKPILNPTVTADDNTVTYTGSNRTFIKYISNATVAINATARNGATISSVKITCDSKSISTATGTINKVTSGTFTFTATDSRGFSTSATLNHTLISYFEPTLNIVESYIDTNGVLTLSFKGKCWRGNFGNQSNEIALRYQFKESSGSYGEPIILNPTYSGDNFVANVTISGLDYRRTYNVQAQLLDKFNAVRTPEKSVVCLPVFDWDKDDFNFNVPVSAPVFIHSIYGGVFNNVSVPTGAVTEIASLTVPKGVYLLVASHQWITGFSSYYVDYLPNVYSRVNGSGGGGASTIEVFEAVHDSTVINFRTYQGTGSAVQAQSIRFWAIRIA